MYFVLSAVCTLLPQKRTVEHLPYRKQITDEVCIDGFYYKLVLNQYWKMKIYLKTSLINFDTYIYTTSLSWNLALSWRNLTHRSFHTVFFFIRNTRSIIGKTYKQMTPYEIIILITPLAKCWQVVEICYLVL